MIARISRTRLEGRKEDGAEESSSVPTPKTLALSSDAEAACVAAGLAVLRGWETLADCWKVC